ncbi:L,D-transpeptidase family protein [Candidatus Pacebacteria bacterium]|nr:L,D-transpeptidase family protein [Candidatus Paceibacterota bacterium]
MLWWKLCSVPMVLILTIIGGVESATAAEEYRYGSFRVVNNTIVGGQFKPDPAPPLVRASRYPHVIIASFGSKRLSYYRKEGAQYVGVFGRAVVTPAAETLKGRVKRGKVLKIDTRPTWCPSRGLIRDLNRRVRASSEYSEADVFRPDRGGCFSFGHPQNAMGIAKFIVAGWGPIRLHGTPGFPVNFAEVETYGCVRLLNSDMTSLLTELGTATVREGLEMIFVP